MTYSSAPPGVALSLREFRALLRKWHPDKEPRSAGGPLRKIVTWFRYISILLFFICFHETWHLKNSKLRVHRANRCQQTSKETRLASLQTLKICTLVDRLRRQSSNSCKKAGDFNCEALRGLEICNDLGHLNRRRKTFKHSILARRSPLFATCPWQSLRCSSAQASVWSSRSRNVLSGPKVWHGCVFIFLVCTYNISQLHCI